MLNSDRLIKLRKKFGFTQEYIAKKLGIDRSSYCKYEKGNVQPPNTILINIAKLFNVTSDYLFGISNIPNPTLPDKEFDNNDTKEIERILAKIDSGNSKRGILMQHGGDKRYLVDLSEEEFEQVDILLRIIDEKKRLQKENEKKK